MQPFIATVLENAPLGDAMRRLTLQADALCNAEIRPGCFVHLKVPNAPALLLRRPISIMGANAAQGRLTLGIAPKGEGTRLICAVQPGQTLDVLGPLGNGFDAGAAKRVWLLGGGAGVAPMCYLCEQLAARGCTVIAAMGFRSAAQVFATEIFGRHAADFRLCTDDGSAGFGGTALAALQNLPVPELILACGPLPMLRAVQAFALAQSIPCRLSLEQRMGCGYGACLTCSCKAAGREGYLRVCADGPVFDATEVTL